METLDTEAFLEALAYRPTPEWKEDPVAAEREAMNTRSDEIVEILQEVDRDFLRIHLGLV
jgi:hypothetical protein